MQEALYRLLMALACGAVIGLNRDRHRKSAGFRTFSLVRVGSAVVALAMTQTSSDANAVSRCLQTSKGLTPEIQGLTPKT